MKQPNAIIYMSLGGLRAGAIRGGFFGFCIVLFFVLLDSGATNIGTLLGLASVAFVVGLVIGAPIGLGVGFLSGFAIDWFVRRQTLPLSEAAQQQLRQQTRIIVVVLCGLGAVIAFATVFSGSILLALLPALICLWAMLGVSRRYLDKLAAWEKPKHKDKLA